MILDVDKGNLSFMVNNNKIATEPRFNKSGIKYIAFSDIKKAKDLKYRMEISCIFGDSVKIVSFSKECGSC